MYGIDRVTKWFDYDLVSAYTTAMCLLDHPNYAKGRFVEPTELKNWSPEELLYSYTIITGSFRFPKETKYPSIPVRLDDDTTVYPLEGVCTLTGAELLCAYNQGCVVKMKEVYTIPFHTRSAEKQKESVLQSHKNEKFKTVSGLISGVNFLKSVTPTDSIDSTDSTDSTMFESIDEMSKP